MHEELKELSVRVAEFRKQAKHYQSNALLTDLREDLREQRGKIMARLNNEQRKIVATAPTSTPATPSSHPDLVGSKIKLNLPTFDGNSATWTYFWSRFEQVIQAEKVMVEPLKVSALVDAMKDSKAKEVAESAVQDGYAAVVDALKTTYNLPRLLFPIHWEGISHQPKPVRWDKEDIDNLKK